MQYYVKSFLVLSFYSKITSNKLKRVIITNLLQMYSSYYLSIQLIDLEKADYFKNTFCLKQVFGLLTGILIAKLQFED